MSERRACADFDRSSLSRRQMLQVGALGTLGLSLPAALRAEAQLRPEGAGQVGDFPAPVRRGAAAGHLRYETERAGRAPRRVQADLLEPAGRRGLRAAAPYVHGSWIILTVVRSVNHRTSQHNSAAYYSLVGHQPLADIVSATASASDFPAYGSVVSKLAPSRAARAHFRLAPLDDRRRRVPHTGPVRGLSRQGTRSTVHHQESRTLRASRSRS